MLNFSKIRINAYVFREIISFLPLVDRRMRGPELVPYSLQRVLHHANVTNVYLLAGNQEAS